MRINYTVVVVVVVVVVVAVVVVVVGCAICLCTHRSCSIVHDESSLAQSDERVTVTIISIYIIMFLIKVGNHVLKNRARSKAHKQIIQIINSTPEICFTSEMILFQDVMLFVFVFREQ